MVWQAIIPAVASLAGTLGGGLLQAGASSAANATSAALTREQLDQQERFFYHNDLRQHEFWDRNAALQREFAQMGVKWRVEDAKAAGLHPLFAMGGGGASFSPTAYAGSSPSPVGVPGQHVPNYGEMGSRLGQDLSRAFLATREKQEKVDEVGNMLRLDNMRLQNELLSSQIARNNMVIAGPSFPSGRSGSVMEASQGNLHLGPHKMEPHEVHAPNPQSQATVGGPSTPQIRWGVAGNGALQPFPPKDLIEDQEIFNPVFIRWLASNEGRRPPENVWRHAFPGARDIRWSTTELGWVPVRDVNPTETRPYVTGRDGIPRVTHWWRPPGSGTSGVSGIRSRQGLYSITR